MAKAKWAIGTTFQRGDGEKTEGFDSVGKITNMSPPEISTDTVDSTSVTSETGREEIVPTIIRGGEMTLSMDLLPLKITGKAEEGHDKFRSDMRKRKRRNYRLEFSDETFYQFSAFVVGFSIGEITPEGLLTATVTLRSTGKPFFGPVT